MLFVPLKPVQIYDSVTGRWTAAACWWDYRRSQILKQLWFRTAGPSAILGVSSNLCGITTCILNLATYECYFSASYSQFFFPFCRMTGSFVQALCLSSKLHCDLSLEYPCASVAKKYSDWKTSDRWRRESNDLHRSRLLSARYASARGQKKFWTKVLVA